VENALRSVPGVHHAVAAVVGTNAPVLVAAVAGEPEGGLPERVTNAVAARLPSYMVPAHIQFLERIPLTPNGKLDRPAVVALLQPQPAHGDTAPRNDVEAALADIVAEALGLESVGVHDDFFALGGDSVLGTAVIARVREWLDVDHAVVADLFATRTVAGLAARLQDREAALGTPQRLAVIARHYLEIAALSDEEVLAEG
jgi:mycobactin phenyloxazoline synthetase